MHCIGTDHNRLPGSSGIVTYLLHPRYLLVDKSCRPPRCIVHLICSTVHVFQVRHSVKNHPVTLLRDIVRQCCAVPRKTVDSAENDLVAALRPSDRAGLCTTTYLRIVSANERR
jgi:hypothetical protein